MSELLNYQFYHNSVYDWSISMGIILSAIILGKIIYWIFGSVLKKMTAKTKSQFDDIIIDMIEEPITLVFLLTGIWFSFSRLTFNAELDVWLTEGFYLTLVINVTWLIARLTDAFIKDYFIPRSSNRDSGMNMHLLPILRKFLRSTIWIVGLVLAKSSDCTSVIGVILK